MQPKRLMSRSFLRGAVTGCALTTLLLVACSLVFRGVTLTVGGVYFGREADHPSLSEGRSLLGFWGAGSTSTAEGSESEPSTKLSVDTESETDPITEVVSTTRSASVNEIHPASKHAKKQLLVVVTTSRSMLERTHSRIRSTWGRETTDYRMVVGTHGASAAQLEELTSSPNVLVSPTHSDFPSFPHLTLSSINSLLDTIRSNFIEQYKWFLIAPSNLYISVPALEGFLRELNPNRVVYIGHPNTLTSPKGFHYCAGGPGIVMSGVALSRIERECPGGSTESSSSESGYKELGQCFIAKLKTECSLGANVSSIILN